MEYCCDYIAYRIFDCFLLFQEIKDRSLFVDMRSIYLGIFNILFVLLTLPFLCGAVETIHLVLPESPFTRVTQPGALTLMAPDYPSRAVLGQLWADRMQHKVTMLVVAQFEILKISQKWVNHQNENYFGPGWGEEARALLALPFSFQVNQWGTSFPSATWATQQKQNISCDPYDAKWF